MRRLVAARLRHQPAQAVLVTLLAALVSLSAVLGVAYARAVEDSVQRQTLSDAPVSASGVAVTVTSDKPPSPDQLRDDLGPVTGADVWGTPIAGAQADGLEVVPGRRHLVSVVTRDDLCDHLAVVQGDCLHDATDETGQALVSTRALSDLGLRIGDRLPIADGSTNATTPVLQPTVVGAYQPFDPAEPYWFDRPVTRDAVAGTTTQGGDTVFVDWPTLSGGTWHSMVTTLDVPLLADRAGIGQVAAVHRAADRLTAAARAVSGSTTTQLPALLQQADQQRRDARAALPLLALQVVVLSLVVLGYVAAASTEQRRPEVALARLRGQQPSAAAGLLVRELGVLVLLGALVGGLLGWGLARLTALVWLAPGTGVPFRWPMAAAAGLAGLAGLVAATVVAVPTVREPLVTLLRSVPPRSSAVRAGVGDGVVIALCVAGLVTLLSGDPGDPSALVAPGLLALAGGLLLSQAVVPVAGALGRSRLRRGRLRSGLAAVAVSRRPALRRLVAIVAVAVALLVFAAGADAVARDQRRVGADQRVGASVVLTVEASSPTALARAVAGADPSRHYATPVLVARGTQDQGPRSLAVDPASFGGIAFWGRSDRPGAGAPSLAPLQPTGVQPVPLTGTTLRADVTLESAPITPDENEQWLLGPGSNPEPGLHRPVTLDASVEDDEGQVHVVHLGQLDAGTAHLGGTLPCPDGCLLRRLDVVRPQSDTGGAELRVTVRLTDGRGPVDLRAGDRGWSPSAPFTPVELSAGSGGGLTLHSRSFGTSMGAQRSDVPQALPALVAGQLPGTPSTSIVDVEPESLVDAPAVEGGTRTYERLDTLPAVPGVRREDGTPAPSLLVSYDLARRIAGSLAARTEQQVWLGRDDHGRETALVRALESSGVQVVGRTSAADEAEHLASQGSGLALRLALLVGAVALVLAAFVLGVSVATSGRVRAHDLAGLRVVGVPRSVVAGAAVREQLVVAVVGVVSGAVLGGVGAALMLSRPAPSSVLPDPDVTVAWPAALVAVALSLVVLGGVCLLLGRRLAARAVPELLVEGAR
jgi:predicted lysophospholipase L1 biosynthesis ABC-type transport system permease subunit